MGKAVERRTWFTPRQKQLLKLVSKNQNFRNKFYLTGGTALAAVYYNHRESQDLDFFSSQPFSSRWLHHFIYSLRPELNLRAIRLLPTNINGFQLVWKNKQFLNLDFIYYSFKKLAPPTKVYGIEIDSLPDITANKLDTILTRKNLRDYLDLYIIMKREKLTITDILKLHQKKTEMQIEALGVAKSLLQVSELSDFPKMKLKFSRQRMINFFESQARRLKKQIFF